MEIKEININEIKINEKNPRKITKDEMEKLKSSIKEFGFIQPILLNNNENRYNVIIGGHQRYEAAKQLKIEKIPCIYINLDENKENILNIALNSISGEFDDLKLAEILYELNKTDLSLNLTGLDTPIIDKLIKSIQKSYNEELKDIIPETPKNPKSKKGELWYLGEHRFLIGDSTNPEDIKRLMQNDKAKCVFTDPPYGVSYKGTNNPNGKDWGVMANDGLRENELYEFLNLVFNNIYNYTIENPAIYVCYASINHKIFELALNSAGFKVKQVLIWSKHLVLGHSDYHWSHEPILYAIKDKNCEWIGDRTHTTLLNGHFNFENMTKDELIEYLKQIQKQSDILEIKKDNTSEYMHATQKPTELSQTCFLNNTRPKDIILDTFGGSGSTLIACEMTNRICRTIEISTNYADVILERYYKFTNKEPIREDGKKWTEL